MSDFAVEVPQAVMFDTKMNEMQTRKFINQTIALEYYKTYGISLGYCAQIAQMTKEDFLVFLGQHGISVFHFDDEKEFLDELSNA
ncbi:MAG: UPF0175 family protein [Treponemataceae bacterium]|nr:UPF0175 family protein [Treponemataceae bacterium]